MSGADMPTISAIVRKWYLPRREPSSAVRDIQEEVNRGMTHDEVVANEIAKYMNLLRIEAAENPEVEIQNQKTEARAKLESFGVNVENLKICT